MVLPIPLSMLTAGRTIGEARLAPDGRWLAFLARTGQHTAIMLIDLDETAPGAVIERQISAGEPAFGRGPFGGNLVWSPTSDQLIYVATNGKIYSQPRAGGGATLVGDPGAGRTAAGLAMAPAGDSVVAEIDQAEIWRFSLAGGAERLDDGSHAFVVDPHISADGSVTMWTGWSPPEMPWDGARTVVLVNATGERLVGEVEHSDHQPRTAAAGQIVSVRDDTGYLNIWCDGEVLVDEPYEHAQPTWSSGQHSYAISPDGTQIAFSRNEDGFGTLNVVTVESKQVSQVDRGIFSHLDWQESRLMAVRSGAKRPPQINLYDSRNDYSRRTVAFGAVAGWETYQLVEPEIVTVTTDDTTLHARRYRAGMGKMLVLVHGGPTGQWPIEWNPTISYWWSRGYDCYVVDPRGSTGFGRRYQQALNGAWGELDVSDTATLIEHAHRQGWATPATTVLAGGSSGGLTVLGVLAEFGHLVAGGVARYPVTDLALLAQKSHRYEAHYTIPLVGPLTATDRYWELSPLSYAGQITKPLLLLHGTDDPVVPIESTRAFAQRFGGSDLEYIEFVGAGHGFRDPQHVHTDYVRTEAFLERVTGAATNASPAEDA